MSGSHIFVDESVKKDYVVVYSIVDSNSVATARKELSNLLLAGQRSLHMKDERDGRRKRILSTIEALDVSTVVLVAPRQNLGIQDARERCLKYVSAHATKLGARRLVLDRSDGTQHRDRRLIADSAREAGFVRPVFEYLHQSRHEEPMLWIPDAIGWSWSRGGPWRERVRQFVTQRDV